MTGAEKYRGGDVFMAWRGDVFVETFGCGGGDCVREGKVGAAAGLAADGDCQWQNQ